MNIPERIKDVHCPQCKKQFTLSWAEWRTRPTTLIIRACPSGGMYDVTIVCPHCQYEEEL